MDRPRCPCGTAALCRHRCRKCFQKVEVKVRAGKLTWEEAEKLGLVGPRQVRQQPKPLRKKPANEIIHSIMRGLPAYRLKIIDPWNGIKLAQHEDQAEPAIEARPVRKKTKHKRMKKLRKVVVQWT